MTELTLGAEGRALCALLSMAISMLAFLPYYRDTIAWRTSPQRASWLIWGILSAISFASQVSEGATFSLLFAAVQCGGTLGILVLSFSRGAGGYFAWPDSCVLLVAAAGLALWFVTDNAAWALAISCGISLVGGSVTVAKAYADPSSETLSFWGMSFVASCFAIASVGAWDPVLLLYPTYLFILKAAILTAMFLGHRAPKAAQPTRIVVTGRGPMPGMAGSATVLRAPKR